MKYKLYLIQLLIISVFLSSEIQAGVFKLSKIKLANQSPLLKPLKLPFLIQTDTIYNSKDVQVKPKFPDEGWIKFMFGYKTPQNARANNVSGIVYVSFIIEKDGSLTNIKLLKDLGFGTGEEAIRLFKTSPKWSPGIQNGLKVRVAYTVPIRLSTQ